jgi:uncharacterized protein YutE (UPF0331/DUF86 family)
VSPDRDSIAARMSKVRSELALLETIRARGREAFLADGMLQAAAERALQVAIEGCLDIAHHIISREGWERPTDYADLFRDRLTRSAPATAHP